MLYVKQVLIYIYEVLNIILSYTKNVYHGN